MTFIAPLEAFPPDVAGTAYEYITRNTPSQAVIGNFSMTITPVDQNSVALRLPSSFNAASLLSVVGTYTSVITFYPTSDFLAPVPLTVQFTVAVRFPAFQARTSK